MSAADGLNGYQFSHRDTEGDSYREPPLPGRHHIEATGPDGQWAGRLTLVHSSRGHNVFPGANIEVDMDHQRRGVGTALWEQAEQTFPDHKFVHASMSPGGRRLASRMQERNPDKHVLLDDKDLTMGEIEDRL